MTLRNYFPINVQIKKTAPRIDGLFAFHFASFLRVLFFHHPTKFFQKLFANQHYSLSQQSKRN